jgi:glutaredoxin
MIMSHGIGQRGQRPRASRQTSDKKGKGKRMRKIVLVTTNYCPRCEYVKRTVWEPILAACPEQAFTVNGSEAPQFVRQYGIKGAPSILFLDCEEKKGLAYRTFDVDKIIRWLKGERYSD